MLVADLRTEPLVLFVPRIDKDRYYSLQFVADIDDDLAKRLGAARGRSPAGAGQHAEEQGYCREA